MSTVPLKHLADVTLGKMLQSGPELPGQMVRPYLKASNITESGLSLENLQAMPFTAAERKNLTLKRDDILVVEGGSVGRSAWLSDNLPDVYFQNSMNRVRPRVGSDGRFLNYALVMRLQTGYFQAVTNQATIRHLTADKLERTPIPAVGLESQKYIADYLDHETAEIDAFIQDLKNLSQLTAARMESVIERAFHGSDSPAVQLRRLRPIRTSGTSVNGESRPAEPHEYGVLKTGAASKGWLDLSENKAVTDPIEIKRLTAPLDSNRVLVNRANTPELVGSAVLIKNAASNLYLSDKLWSINFDGSNHYVSLALSTRSYREQISTFAVGASSSMQNLSYEDFLRIEIPVPPVSEQNRIADIVTAQSQKMLSLRKDIDITIDLARERRAALITAAVTGQIDVTAKNKPAAEQLEDDIAQGLHKES